MEIITGTFPPKPAEPPVKDAWGRSVISLLLFVTLYYFTFDRSPKYIAMLVGVLLLHEMGHFTAMRICGYKEVKMFFIPFFGAMVTGSKHEVSQKERSVILLAGPVPGILLGCALVMYCYYTTYDTGIMTCARMLIWINVFNLAPVNPLDGGRLIENLFFRANKAVQVGFISLSAVAFVAFAVYYENYILCIIPGLMIGGIKRIDNLSKVRKKLDELHVDYKKTYAELSDREYWLIRQQVKIELSNSSMDAPSQWDPSKETAITINMVKGTLQEKLVNDTSAPGKVFVLFVWLASIALSVYFILLARHMYAGYISQNGVFFSR
ncbi:MAG TPA: site-2 protease family protein [Bacteroidia bacterium]|jgi:Zn-dependent protease